ncbi:hypothetical protein GCM10007967_10560 [Xylanimonas ulmi]
MTAALVAVLLTAAGCATTDDAPASPAPTATDSPAASPTASPSPTPSPGEDPSQEPGDATSEGPGGPAFEDPANVVTAEPTAAGAGLTVTDVRAATHDGFDRVVFDLGGAGAPGWRVEYVDDALDDGSGLPVEVAGGAVLQVRISGVGLPMDTGVEEYAGDVVTLPGGAVRQVVYRFMFEGYATAFLGVDEPRPFRVFALQDPARVVVDIER